MHFINCGDDSCESYSSKPYSSESDSVQVKFNAARTGVKYKCRYGNCNGVIVSHTCSENISLGDGSFDAKKIKQIFQSILNDAVMLDSYSRKEDTLPFAVAFARQEINKDLYKLKAAIQDFIFKNELENDSKMPMLVRDIIVPQISQIKGYENYFDNIVSVLSPN